MYGRGREDHEADGKPHKGDLYDPQRLALAWQWRAPPPGLAGESPFHTVAFIVATFIVATFIVATFIVATFIRATLTYANGPPDGRAVGGETVVVVTSCGLPPSWRDP